MPQKKHHPHLQLVPALPPDPPPPATPAPRPAPSPVVDVDGELVEACDRRAA